MGNSGDAVFTVSPVRIPSREGKEGFSLQEWVLPVRNNPPLHPSGGGESHLHALWRAHNPFTAGGSDVVE
jgi:hypothetical protein